MATDKLPSNPTLAGTVLTEPMFYGLSPYRRLRLTELLGAEPIGWYIGKIEDDLRRVGKRYFAATILAALDDIVRGRA